MTLDRFLTDGEPTWHELESLLTDAGSRPARLGTERLLRMGELYRSTTADLSTARQRFTGDPVVARLESLVIRGRTAVYAKNADRMSLRRFYSRRYWELIFERPRLLLLAIAALVVPALFGFLYARTSPETIIAILPPAFLWVTVEQPAGTDLGLSGAQLTEFSFQVLVNNIRVTVTAFAVGILLGILTFILIAFNGLIFGALTALAVDAGNGALLVEAVIAHGILELSCIVIGGLAGFRIASGVISPGVRPRRVALVEEAGPAAQLALGTAPFLVLAGFVEGFVSRTGTSAGPTVVIGFALGASYWITAVTRGTGQKRTRAFADK